MSSSAFYGELPLLTDFGDVGRAQSHTPLPEDWHVVMCDVRDSTAAIESGRYKNVNTLGAALITAMLNAAGDIQIPFVFEGDGAMLCVPPQLLPSARAALLQTQAMARASFALDLRIAALPVAEVRAAGFDIRVARYRTSEHFVQAMFAGGGMAYAERCMKDPSAETRCRIEADRLDAQANYDGLECRWQDIPSRHGETVSLMARVLLEDEPRAGEIYRALIAKVGEIYGSDEACHPVWPPNLTFSLAQKQLNNEVGVRASGSGAWGKWLYLIKIRGMTLLGWFFTTFGVRTSKTDWGGYKTVLARNSDVKKFNDCYRQILSGNAAQRAALTAWLDAAFIRGELVYGIHVADRAQMTCLVFDYSGRHLHFIDGADGGLFMAAKALKERLAAVR